MGRALLIAIPGSIFNILYGPLNLLGVISESKARSNF